MITCIVCKTELTTVACEGRIENMVVSFCDEDAKWCDNCETVTCKVINDEHN